MNVSLRVPIKSPTPPNVSRVIEGIGGSYSEDSRGRQFADFDTLMVPPVERAAVGAWVEGVYNLLRGVRVRFDDLKSTIRIEEPHRYRKICSLELGR